ncbi:TorF family putative porin [Polynucleobacter sp. AP-Feld-500C-C5]|uniref:TorF family putative porin n=1 Tax=Polynucleobacter sp. AP-Feld-500C-C5 TaxID=2576924 RepID=UPI001C0C6B8B|nr:TorF family putative porin [Polynucleobacter sp. AP-Feld-500C-C5]MBU3633284.1 hypothetical protein [Polynucleobacter sp. AP-Feld-500C-C5]
MKTLHKTAISAVAAGLLSGLAYTPAFAADEPEASPITANLTVVNDYRYRGISQSNFKPAIQGGFDYAHESGFYIGNWNSSISWISDAMNNPYLSSSNAVSSSIEMDFYAGVKKEFIGEGFASDFGVLQYYYPTSGIPNGYVNPNTTELYAAQNFTFGSVTGFAKFSYAVTDTFGNYNSKGSYYPDLTLNYDTGIWGLTANAHVGYQYIAGTYGPTDSRANTNLYSYKDWKAGFTKDFGGGLSAAIAYVGTNAKTRYNGVPGTYLSPQGKDLGRSGGLISLTKTF